MNIAGSLDFCPQCFKERDMPKTTSGGHSDKNAPVEQAEEVEETVVADEPDAVAEPDEPDSTPEPDKPVEPDSEPVKPVSRQVFRPSAPVQPGADG
jgi:hypothetical protein